MRYNSYRQYVTLNGVKRENKNNVLKNLKPYIKNVMRYLPKTEYEKITAGHDNVTFRFMVDAETNTFRSIRLLVTDNIGGSPVIVNQVNIPVPSSATFQGLRDSQPQDTHNDISLTAYTKSGQQLPLLRNAIGTSYSATTLDVSLELVTQVTSSISDLIFFGAQHTGSALAFYAITVDPSADHYICDLNVTNDTYDQLPFVPIIYFE